MLQKAFSNLFKESLLTMSKINKKLISFRLHPELIQKIDTTRTFHSLGARTTFLETAAETYINLLSERRAGSNGTE